MEEYLTVRQAAKLTEKSENAIRHYRKQNLIRFVKGGDGKLRCSKLELIQKLIYNASVDMVPQAGFEPALKEF